MEQSYLCAYVNVQIDLYMYTRIKICLEMCVNNLYNLNNATT